MNKFADDTKVGHSVSVMGDKQFFELTVLAVPVLTKCTTQDTYLLTYKAYKSKLFNQVYKVSQWMPKRRS